ncbi:MAG: DUF3800 domain-containing protein [Candidatus Micrarchaeia archaeon]|jgi:hypothetical protein
MQVFIDASGDDGQSGLGMSSRAYTLAMVCIPEDCGPGLLSDVVDDFQQEHLTRFGYKIRPELKWHDLSSGSREFLTERLLSRQEFVTIIIHADKFSVKSGWTKAAMSERQFRTYIFRSMLWLVCAYSNINSNDGTIKLVFDKELVETFILLINKEASKIRSKKITVSAGMDSKDSQEIQIADCMAGCYNHYRLLKNGFYEKIRGNVCEVELVLDENNEVRQVMRVSDLKKLLEK